LTLASNDEPAIGTCERILHDMHRVAVMLQDLRNRLPARAIGESAVNQDYVLYGRVTQGREDDREYSKRKR
jgi:hypothetical protein